MVRELLRELLFGAGLDELLPEDKQGNWNDQVPVSVICIVVPDGHQGTSSSANRPKRRPELQPPARTAAVSTCADPKAFAGHPSPGLLQIDLYSSCS